MFFHATITEQTFHFRRPAGTSRGVYHTRRSWFVSLTSDRHPGVVGIGECAPLPDLSCDALPDDDYRRLLETFCHQLCMTGEIPYDDMRPYPSMLFGLETALTAFPHFRRELFLTDFSQGRQGIPINGLVWMGNYKEMYERVREKLQQGFHCVKLKIGAIDWQQELSLVKFIREQFSPDDIELRLDANGGFTPEEAPSRLEALAPYAIHSIEQPIRQHQWEQMASLCRQSPIDIALDEELIGVNTTEEKRRLLDAIRPRYIILKPSLHGGMHGTEEWIRLASERHIGWWVTSALESNVGLRSIALFSAWAWQENRAQKPTAPMPCQGLGTGQLFTDNIDMPLEIRGQQLWLKS